MAVVLPPYVTKYFWGDDLSQLNWADHSKYITQTLLEKGDTPSIKWLFDLSKREQIKQLLPNLKLSPRSQNFWQIYLS